MSLLAVVVGLLLGVYGAVLMLTGGAVAGESDAAALHRTKWRSRRGAALIAVGLVILIVGALIVPIENRVALAGPGGVLLFILLDVVALVLDAIGIVLILLSRVAFADVEDLGMPWLGHARRVTRHAIAFLIGGLLAQLIGVSLITL